MKTIKIAILAAFALMLSSCYKETASVLYEDMSISLYPAVTTFNADGTTESGDENCIMAVKVRKGTSVSDEDWVAVPSVSKDWLTVKEATLVSQYTDVSGEKKVEVSEDGIEIVLDTNNFYRRSFDIVITTESGYSKTFSFSQKGSLPDAVIECPTTTVDIPSIGGETDDITYTTNMDKCSYSIEYDGEEKDWLTVVEKGVGKFALNAKEWSSTTQGRSAKVIVTVGTPETTTASATIAVNQLKYDTYYYAYGSSLGLDRQNSVAMDKKDVGIYAVKAFFFDAGNNVVCFNKDSRSERYPVYYLAADGTVKSSDKAVTSSGLKIGANGIYNLVVDFNTNTWVMDRSIKVSNCMPDSELSKYPVKEYPTASGSSKTWMGVSLHWNGGAATGTYKLGSGLVGGTKTGGYGTPSDKKVPYDTRNNAYDTEENGGLIAELMTSDGTQTLAEKYGRLYAAYEFLTGAAKGCLNDAYQMDCPYGVPGDNYADDAGLEMTLENILLANLAAYDATAEGNALAESEHPSLKIQIQGICPFGWHVANMQDWKDLIWAASQASKGSEKEIPEALAYYKSIGGKTITNLASILYSADWFEYTKSSKADNRSSVAESFGWNMFVQGWRLYATGYDYGYNSGTPRFYTIIPIMGQYTSSKKAFWRAYVTGEGVNMTIDDGCDIGNGCGTAVRCVKNYKTK